jgi:hypothetical protein
MLSLSPVLTTRAGRRTMQNSAGCFLAVYPPKAAKVTLSQSPVLDARADRRTVQDSEGDSGLPCLQSNYPKSKWRLC